MHYSPPERTLPPKPDGRGGGVGFRVQGSGSRVQESWVRVQGSRVKSFGLRISGS